MRASWSAFCYQMRIGPRDDEPMLRAWLFWWLSVPQIADACRVARYKLLGGRG